MRRNKRRRKRREEWKEGVLRRRRKRGMQGRRRGYVVASLFKPADLERAERSGRQRDECKEGKWDE